MTDITLTDNERAALEALWRAGGEMALGDMPKELRSAFVELDVKGATLMVRQRKGDFIVVFTAEGRALATELFTPPLTMPTTADAVRAWLEARGLWAEGDSVQIEDASYIYVFLNKGYSVRRCTVKGGGQGFCVAFPRSIIEPEAADVFRAEFDRACDIARALNANREE